MKIKSIFLSLCFLFLSVSNSYGFFSYEKYEESTVTNAVNTKHTNNITNKNNKTVKDNVIKQEVKSEDVKKIKRKEDKTLSNVIVQNKNKDIKQDKIINSSFTLKKGSLQNQLFKYSMTNGYSLIWNAKNDYILEAETVFSGNYNEVIKNIFKSLKANGIFLRAVLYKNNVLEVKD